jgi:valyl-tRNA synthetase
VKKNEVKFFPNKYKKQMLEWLAQMHDWPISRQTVWGIRIPVWYDTEKNPDLQVVFLNKTKQSIKGKLSELLKTYSLAEIESGLQELKAPVKADYVVSQNKPGASFLQETDTFDTWFSSGQWPLVTLKPEEYQTRFPTDFMGTLADILKFWISRMIMFSLYLKKTIPFKHVYLWSMVADEKGIKMSKSKGNVIDPLVLINQYGADAFRAALLFGVAQGGKVNLSESKVRAMRNYCNKIWNIGRFILMNRNPQSVIHNPKKRQNIMSNSVINKLEKEFKALEKSYHANMEKYCFSQAFGDVYEFIWHRLADFYLEALKDEIRNDNIQIITVLEKVFLDCLRLLHPFIPFVTEVVWQQFKGEEESILEANN